MNPIEAIARERRATVAGIAKAALFVASYDSDRSAKALLAEFGVTTDDLRNAGKYALCIEDESRHKECRQAGDEVTRGVTPETEVRRG